MILNPAYKEELISIFLSIDEEFEIWAYGSRINGTSHKGSDLDLVLRTPDLSKLPAEKLSCIIEKIRDSNIPILVELRDWARIPEEFRQNILQNYEVIYKSGSPAYYKT